MASTRYYHSLVDIYQDPPTYDSALMPTSKRFSASNPSPPLRALKDVSSRNNIIFTPPLAETAGHKPSPLKSSHQRLSSPLSSSPSRRPFNNMVSMPPPRPSTLATDSIAKKMQQPLFTTFMASGMDDKENMQHYYPTQYGNQSTKADFPIDADYGQKGTNKRTLMDAAPIQESNRPFKKPKANSSASILPSPANFSSLYDDGSKPGHSYAQLIGMAILRSPNQRLTLSQIYKWISDTYSFYNPTSTGWQNSIRHNLSLNKAFVKQERPKDDPGKGNYWVIEPGTEHQFVKGKQGGKSVIIDSMRTRTRSPSSQSESRTIFKVSKPAVTVPSPSQYMPEPLAPAPELSSDATIPASDAFIPEEEPEEEQEEEANMPPPSVNFLASSSSPVMHSSPPISRHDTPPPAVTYPTSSALRSHRRQTASLDDSGYFSGLSSSAARHPKSQKKREAEHIHFKSRGRAEEEITRIRGSSHDSPTNSLARPARALGFSSQPRMESSPLRPNQQTGNRDTSQMLPPLTPAIKLKAPERPPPSISPNANLRLHRQNVRELIGSPLRDVTVLEENVPWSPEFNLGNGAYVYNDGNDLGFEIFADAESSNDDFNINNAQSNIMNGSPEKRKARAFQENGRAKSSVALGDVTNARHNVNLFTGNKSTNSTPLLKFTPHLQPGFGDQENSASPSKSRGGGGGSTQMNSPSKFFGSPQKQLFSNPMRELDFGAASGGEFDIVPINEWQGPDFLLEGFGTMPMPNQENMGPSMDGGGAYEVGVDLLGGFQRIGSGRHSASSIASTGVPTFNGSLGNGGGRPGVGGRIFLPTGRF